MLYVAGLVQQAGALSDGTDRQTRPGLRMASCQTCLKARPISARSIGSSLNALPLHSSSVRTSHGSWASEAAGAPRPNVSWTSFVRSGWRQMQVMSSRSWPVPGRTIQRLGDDLGNVADGVALL